jgi:hypothetical protein
MTLPVAFSGSSSRKATEAGTLNPAIRVLLQAISSSAVTGPLGTTKALPTCPHPLVGDAGHGGLGDGGVLHQESFDLGRVGVETADDEHVLLAADDPQVAAVVDRPEVSGVQPPVRVDGLRGRGGVVEVAAHDGVAAGQHLAVAGDAQLEALPRGADRRRDVLERAFHNMCRHRGNKLVWNDYPGEEVKGTCRQFTCIYHAWRYSLEGELTFIQQEEEFFGVDKSAYGLKGVRCEV